jgi:predicted nuclease of predicted toxin-antitoxin system
VRLISESAPSLRDPDVLALAVRERRILVTNDSDFGELVFRHGLQHTGVLFLRLDVLSFDRLAARFIEVIDSHRDLLVEFLVVTPGDLRVGRA